MMAMMSMMMGMGNGKGKGCGWDDGWYDGWWGASGSSWGPSASSWEAPRGGLPNGEKFDKSTAVWIGGCLPRKLH